MYTPEQFCVNETLGNLIFFIIVLCYKIGTEHLRESNLAAKQKARLLSSVPYPPSQPEMAWRVWNLDQARELGRVRKEAVGKQGTTFLTPHVGLDHGYHISPLTGGRPDMLVTWEGQCKDSVVKSDPSSATSTVILDKTRFHSGFPLGNEEIAFPLAVKFCSSSSCGEGQVTTFLFFAVKPTFPSSLCSRISPPQLGDLWIIKREQKGTSPSPPPILIYFRFYFRSKGCHAVRRR